jgi:hypothetical protein
MSRAVANVVISTDTFAQWLDKTNQLLFAFSSEIVTANGAANGAVSTGNAYVNGVVGANTLVAVQGLRGGTVATPNTLVITSNTSVSGNLAATGVAHTLTGNTTVTGNTTLTGGAVRMNANVTANGTTHTFNANLVANGTTHSIQGNTTITGRLSTTGNAALAAVQSNTYQNSTGTKNLVIYDSSGTQIFP